MIELNLVYNWVIFEVIFVVIFVIFVHVEMKIFSVYWILLTVVLKFSWSFFFFFMWPLQILQLNILLVFVTHLIFLFLLANTTIERLIFMKFDHPPPSSLLHFVFRNKVQISNDNSLLNLDFPLIPWFPLLPCSLPPFWFCSLYYLSCRIKK